MRPLRIACSDFTPGNEPSKWESMQALARIKTLEFASFGDADLLIYSDFGNRHHDFRGYKVYVTGENMLPDFDQCDLAFTPLESPGDPRAVRLPYFAQVLPSMGNLVRPASGNDTTGALRPGFCCFVASNPRGPERNRFFRMLNRRRPVVSAGRHFNNTGRRLLNKQDFLRGYRMNLAFENTSSPGYITEKLVEPLLAGCIPIYWGAPDVSRYFNPQCMINVSEFTDMRDAVEHILQVASDPERMRAILDAPAFPGNVPPECLSPEYVAVPIARLLDSGKPPGRRIYRKRRLRSHAYSSPLHQSWVSLLCRLDGLAWKMGLGR